MIRTHFEGVDVDDMRAIVGGNATRLRVVNAGSPRQLAVLIEELPCRAVVVEGCQADHDRCARRALVALPVMSVLVKPGWRH